MKKNYFYKICCLILFIISLFFISLFIYCSCSKYDKFLWEHKCQHNSLKNKKPKKTNTANAIKNKSKNTKIKYIYVKLKPMPIYLNNSCYPVNKKSVNNHNIQIINNVKNFSNKNKLKINIKSKNDFKKIKNPKIAKSNTKKNKQ